MLFSEVLTSGLICKSPWWQWVDESHDFLSLPFRFLLTRREYPRSLLFTAVGLGLSPLLEKKPTSLRDQTQTRTVCLFWVCLFTTVLAWSLREDKPKIKDQKDLSRAVPPRMVSGSAAAASPRSLSGPTPLPQHQHWAACPGHSQQRHLSLPPQ